jgi:antirestriction protein ArdC
MSKTSSTAREPRADIYQTVTDSIIAAITAGAGEWRMPWHRSGGVQPVNVASNKFYRGINTLALWGSDEINGFGSSVWGTYRQWDALGAQVRKGSKGTQIVFWKTLQASENEDGDDAQPADRPRFVARGFTVFNSSQVDGWDLIPVLATSELDRINHADNFVSATNADIRHGGSRAYYTPGGDFIQMPPLNCFSEILPYYSTLLHELTHWTSSKNRCDRELGAKYGDQAYAFEELVAELGAAYLCGSIGLTVHPRQDHAQYLESWLRVLKEDKRAIFRAAGLAQRAADYLHSLQPADDGDLGEISDHEAGGPGLDHEPIARAA